MIFRSVKSSIFSGTVFISNITNKILLSLSFSGDRNALTLNQILVVKLLIVILLRNPAFTSNMSFVNFMSLMYDFLTASTASLTLNCKFNTKPSRITFVLNILIIEDDKD